MIKMSLNMRQFLFFLMTGFSLAANKTVIDIEYYYTANSDQDADFVVSQLSAELQDPLYPNLKLLTLSIGGVTINIDQSGKYSCQAENSICETSLVHYCFEFQYQTKLTAFLRCTYSHELYPIDLFGASQQCAEKFVGQDGMDAVNSCTKNETTLDNYGEAVLRAQSLRPLFTQTPHLLLNEDYSTLAGIDLRKALCRVEESDIWQCESVDKYKEPKVEVFYSVYEQEASDFFLSRFNQTDFDLVESAALLLSIIPNPSKVVDCDQSEPSCWNHQAHWCAHDNTAIAQLAFIQCTFQQDNGQSRTAEEIVKSCLPGDQYETVIKPCIENISASTTTLKHLQKRLNSLVDPAQQGSLEIIIRDQSNVKAKDGLLQELCYNYFDVDNETFGCKVNRPTVQIFYESHSPNLAETLFTQFRQQDQFAPFETVMNLELIPYGRTTVDPNGVYRCPDGETQCRANWIHACLLKNRFGTTLDKYQVLQFIACTSDYNEKANPVEQAKECLAKVYEDEAGLWDVLDDCAQNDAALKEQMRNKTEAIGLTQIPEFVIDGEKKTTHVEDNLLVFLCRSFDPIKPRVCFEIDSGTSQILRVSVFLTGDAATQTFVQSQLKPLLTTEPRDQNLRLRDVIEWQFVPWGPSEYNSTSGEINCATGANECLVNRILACATTQRQNGHWGSREDRLRMISFLVCFFDSVNWESNPLDTANQCNSNLSPLDNYAQLWQCAVQDGKEQVLIKMKKLTDNYPNIGKFPSVAIGTELKFDDLNTVLCDNYKASLRPAECQNEPTTTGSLLTTDSGNSGFSAIPMPSISFLVLLYCLQQMY